MGLRIIRMQDFAQRPRRVAVSGVHEPDLLAGQDADANFAGIHADFAKLHDDAPGIREVKGCGPEACSLMVRRSSQRRVSPPTIARRASYQSNPQGETRDAQRLK